MRWGLWRGDLLAEPALVLYAKQNLFRRRLASPAAVSNEQTTISETLPPQTDKHNTEADQQTAARVLSHCRGFFFFLLQTEFQTGKCVTFTCGIHSGHRSLVQRKSQKFEALSSMPSLLTLGVLLYATQRFDASGQTHRSICKLIRASRLRI